MSETPGNSTRISMNIHRLVMIVFLALGGGAAATVTVQKLLSNQANGDRVSTEKPTVPTSRDMVCDGYVDLKNGITPLIPAQPGKVARLAVQENDHVTAAAPLLYLDEQAAMLVVEEAKAAALGAQAQLALARKAPEEHELKLAMQKDAQDAATAKLDAARQGLARKRELEKSNLINVREVAVAEELVKELEAVRHSEEKKLAYLQLHNPQQDVRHAEAEADRLQAKLKQAEHALAECVLKAPQAGTVIRVLATPGAMLGTSHEPALLFAPDEPRIVRAEVEQEFAGQVAHGQTAELRDFVSNQLLGTGKVARLSDWYLRRRFILQEPTRFNDTRTMECIITLDPGRPPPRIGQRVRVFFVPAPP